MSKEISNSKRLAKNTMLLYVRMLFSMVISLYTSRVILQQLGAEDYGIYNVVAGFISLFTLISGTLSASISRNLTYALGEGDIKRLKKIFSMSINIQVALIVLVFVILEPIGIWYVNNKLVVDLERLYATNWVFQISLITFAVNLFSMPYNASIVSHERMDAYAYIGLLDVILKLAAVFLLVLSPIDKFVFYALVILIITLTVQLLYYGFCRRMFEECRYEVTKDKDILTCLLNFAGWNLLGSSAMVLRNQGLNIMINMFFGPTVNAARAIAIQVNTSLYSFVTNFMTALTPQLVKAYAQGNTKYLLACIYKGAKFSYFLLFVLSVPILIETESILNIWLSEVPPTTLLFVRYLIVDSLIDTLSRTNINANNATGNIKLYQIIVGGLNLLILPCAYLALTLGVRPEDTELISLGFMAVRIVPGIMIVKRNIPISLMGYVYNVYMPVLIVTTATLIPSILIHTISEDSTIYSLFISMCLYFLIAVLTVIIFGLTSQEKEYLKNHIRQKYNFNI